MSADREESPFEALGIPPSADERQVRKAFAAKLREARASGPPEAVERVQRAFEAIRDPDALRQWRTIAENRSEFDGHMRSAEEAAARDQPDEAVRLFEEALRVVPDFQPALLRIAAIESRRGRFEEALAASARLIEVAPSTGDHHDLRARILAKRASGERNQGRRRSYQEQALASARKARELGSDPAREALLEIALLKALGMKAEAREATAAAVRDARKLGSAELDIFLEFLRLDARPGNSERFRDTLAAMERLLPENPDARRSVAVALGNLAIELNALRPAHALQCAELASTCCPEDPEVRRLLEAFQAATRPLPPTPPRPLIEERAASTGDFGWRRYLFAFLLFVLVRGLFHCPGSPQPPDAPAIDSRIERREARPRPPGEVPEPRKRSAPGSPR